MKLIDAEPDAELLEKMRAMYEKTSGGPNPYYRCKQCGEELPGSISTLAEHATTGGIGVPPCSKKSALANE